jgi:hypothetical protein
LVATNVDTLRSLVANTSRCGEGKSDLNYRTMVERNPDLKEEIGGFIPGYDISSLLDEELAR